MYSLLQLLRAAERTLQLAEMGRYELDALLLPTEDTVTVWDICPDTDFEALLVTDAMNRCVKAVAASTSATLVFQCVAHSRPRALQLVRPVAGGGATLLLIEWLEIEQKNARYALVFAARNGQRFKETRRLFLPALAKEDPTAPVSIMATTNGRFVLIGNSGVKALEVVDARDSSGIARLAASLPLYFELFAFSMGEADGKELLAATERSTSTVHLLTVDISSGVAALNPLTRLSSAESSQQPNRVLLFGRDVLLGFRHASSDSHSVKCIHISGALLQKSQLLRIERQVKINCWRVKGEQVLLFD